MGMAAVEPRCVHCGVVDSSKTSVTCTHNKGSHTFPSIIFNYGATNSPGVPASGTLGHHDEHHHYQEKCHYCEVSEDKWVNSPCLDGRQFHNWQPDKKIVGGETYTDTFTIPTERTMRLYEYVVVEKSDTDEGETQILIFPTATVGTDTEHVKRTALKEALAVYPDMKLDQVEILVRRFHGD